jgi:hypothetical protein
MTQRNSDLFKVLIREIGQDGKADVVLGKALRVLPETELLMPVSDLLHRGSSACRTSPAHVGKFIPNGYGVGCRNRVRKNATLLSTITAFGTGNDEPARVARTGAGGMGVTVRHALLVRS